MNAVKREGVASVGSVHEVFVALIEWLFSLSRRTSSVSLTARRLDAARGAWLVLLNTTGNALEPSNVRRLVRSPVLFRAIVASRDAALPAPYVLEVTSEAATFILSPLDNSSEVCQRPGTHNVRLGNQLRMCFVGLSGDEDAVQAVVLQEVIAAVEPDAFVHMQVDQHVVARAPPAAVVRARCNLGGGARACITLLLFDERPRCASVAVFNGRRHVVGAPDDATLESVLRGLLEGGLALRTQADAVRPWRLLGEWLHASSEAHDAMSLVAVVALSGEDGEEADGSRFKSRADEALGKCAALAARRLGARVKAVIRERARKAVADSIRDTHAGHIGQLFEALLLQGQGELWTRAAAAVARVARPTESARDAIARCIVEKL